MSVLQALLVGLLYYLSDAPWFFGHGYYTLQRPVVAGLLVGIIMAAFGNGSINFIFWLSGDIFILIGIIQILLKSVDLKGGLITIIIGIILIIIGWIDPVAKILVGIILILSALPAVLGTSSSLSEKFGMKPVDVIMIVLLIVGICLIVGLALDVASGVADILIRVGGIILLIVGIIDLVKALKS